MSLMSDAVLIAWAELGLEIEKEIETDESLEIYVSVPESSYHRDAHNKEMSGMYLSKRFKEVMVALGVKRLAVKSRTRFGECWTKAMADAANEKIRRRLYGSQY